MALLFCCYETLSVWHSRVYWLNKYLSHFLCFRCSLSGVSPFQGETVEETCRRITDVKYEFNPKHFDPISQQAKDFITALLVKNPKWVKAHSKLCSFFLFFFFPFSFFTFSLESSPHNWSVGSTVRKFMQNFHELASSNFYSRSQSFDSFCLLFFSVRDRSLTLTKRIEALGTRMSNFALERPSLAGGIQDKTGLWHFRSFNLVPRVFPLSRKNPANSPVHACILIKFLRSWKLFPIGYTWSVCWLFIISNVSSLGSLTPLPLNQWCLRCFWRLATTYTRLYFNRRKRADCQICLNSPWIRVSNDECFLLDTPFS